MGTKLQASPVFCVLRFTFNMIYGSDRVIVPYITLNANRRTQKKRGRTGNAAMLMVQLIVLSQEYRPVPIMPE